MFYRVENTDFGDQAVALDGEYEATEEECRAWHDLLKENGVKIVAPPMWMRELPSLFICYLKVKLMLTIRFSFFSCQA